MVAVRGAEPPHEVGVQQRVRGDPDDAQVERARRHALVRLDPVAEPLGGDLRRGAGVRPRPPPARVPLEHTARAGGRHRVEALARRAAPCEAGVRTEEDYLCFRRAEDDQETERGEELGGHGIILDALAM